MKKILFAGMLLGISYLGFSQATTKSVRNTSFMCTVYTALIGDDSGGCGGGGRVCCANTSLNHT